ncbi:hypothetical protein Agub_g13989 [Astrephomene gubernaculifera]|uniref:Uncharacterized protein n=1 Tax=Astrephomene gubernaculifera TaxID=47775 RepID=A0AAD3HSM3_9CHLO|nr:hypothetical protein Agub_g13989 [Astrephomene gubernaculifera]
MTLRMNASRPTAAHVARHGALPRRVPRLLTTRVRAEKSALAKLSDAMGMPTDEGYFGFTPFSEMWVGRWAMIGFVSSVAVEFATGKGTLAQLGLSAPSTPLLAALLLLSGGATAAASAVTVQQLRQRSMSRTQLERYRSFLGLTRGDELAAESAARSLKGGRPLAPAPPPSASAGAAAAAAAATSTAGDTAPTMEAATTLIAEKEEGRAAGGSLTGVVSTSSAAAADARPQQAPTQPAAAATSSRNATLTAEELYGLDEGKYARDVEIANGRAAMLGFLAAVLVEAGSGRGILAQLVLYGKLSGLLGAASGF